MKTVRSPLEYTGLGRTRFASILRKKISKRIKNKLASDGIKPIARDGISRAQFVMHADAMNHKITELLERKSNWAKWAFASGPAALAEWLGKVFGSKPDYPDYTDYETNGVYEMEKEQNKQDDEPVIVALAADWGSDTTDAIQITHIIESYSPEYTIHLGDTYFDGSEDEIDSTFFGEGSWHRGTNGSFAMLGNHEMLSNGEAYFGKLLQSISVNQGGKEFKQHASFFCLQNDHWRIIGLDTGFNGIFSGDSCELEEIQIDWLRNTVKLNEDNRGIIILSHHQYCTSFIDEKEYSLPAEQLAKIISPDRRVLWLWGHEHRFSIYKKYKTPNGITAYGRCIGHGGMPINVRVEGSESVPISPTNNKVVLYDSRIRMDGGLHQNHYLGYNGFALLKFVSGKVIIEYRDSDDKINKPPLVREEWSVNLDNGNITGTIDNLLPIELNAVNDVNDAVN